MTEVSERRAATRKRLVRAAITVFAQRGVMAASVEEICDEAGFTRGAFYSNFESKDELCLALLSERADTYLAAARTAVATMRPAGADVHDLLKQAIDQFAHTVSEEPDGVLAMMELRLYAAREPGVRDAFTRAQAAINESFASLIGQVLAEHHLTTVLPVHDVLYLLHAMYDQISIDQLIEGRRDPAKVSEALALMLQSVLAP
ncbi:MAG TPA: TetR/AcrR family transcriptional regulator [Propionibacteriaceae bacterium]|nr:TetR/AcrR family transcriptional regulator [Propionibacteriaceae bacterium]